MRNTTFLPFQPVLRLFITTLFMGCFYFTGFGQLGNTYENPIVAGTFRTEFEFCDTQNTTDFTNNYTGRSSNDVFYKFTITRTMLVTISHCGSLLNDTYLWLLSSSGDVD